ncbi:MAG: flagellar biosynthetic protein FliQ [Kofleriaceae bacterium]
MSTESVLDLWREALTVLVTVAAPFLITALVIGLAVAILQTATQLQESILAFVPKLVAALIVIAVSGHWALDKLNKFTTDAFTAHTERRAGELPKQP